MEEYKKALIILTVFAIGIAGGYAIRHYGKLGDSRDISARDTLIIERQSEPVVIEKLKPELIVRRDTVLKFYPFTAKADTVIMKDTIYMSYSFPENLFDLSIFPGPDSIRYVNTMIELPRKEEPWWIKPAYFLGGMTIGATAVGIAK